MMRNERVVKWLNNDAKPYLGVMFLQVTSAGSAILSKAALNQGMNPFTFSFYRNAIAAVIFAPFALFLERKTRPTMTTSIFFKIVLLALLEQLNLNLYYVGMRYTTATISVTMLNLIPAMTFLLAWIFRLEKVKIRNLHSQAKIVGTASAIGGAMIMTLVKGPIILLPWTKHSNDVVSHSAQHVLNQHSNPIKATLLLAGSCCSTAIFIILQANMIKSYPAGLSLTTLICTIGSLQCSILTLIVERGNASVWSLQWDMTLLTYVYHGLVRSGAVYYIYGIIMKVKGPVFVTAFNPLSMVLVAIIGSFVLSEKLYMGRVLGAVVVLVGLYLVIWGKSKDQTSPDNNDALPIDHKQPQVVQGFNKDITVSLN